MVPSFSLPDGWEVRVVIDPPWTKWPRQHLRDGGAVRRMEPGDHTQRDQHTIDRLLTPRIVSQRRNTLPSYLSHCYLVSLL